MRGRSAGAQSDADTLTRVLISGASTSSRSVFRLQIMDYSATDKHKSVLTRYDLAGLETHAHATRWANTAIITTLEIFGIDTETLAAGTTLSLYGIVA
jgi:hypothetical protein